MSSRWKQLAALRPCGSNAGAAAFRSSLSIRPSRAFAKAIGQRAKTDPIDAAVIAHFAEAIKPQVRPLPDEATRLLADLVARRGRSSR